MAGNLGSKKRGADINVVPLIDIVLVLLIIFMVITPLIVREMDLRLPDAEEQAIQPEDVPQDQVVLVMSKDFNTYLNKELIARTDLETRLKAIFLGRPTADRVLFFDAEDDTNYGETVKVLDIVRGSGVEKIGMITDRTNMAAPGATPGVPGVPGVPGEPVPGSTASPGTPPG